MNAREIHASADAMNPSGRRLVKIGTLAVASALSLHFVAKYALVRFAPDKLVPGPDWADTAPLAVHVLAGTIALLVGPLQFSSRLRERRTHLHRLVGKTYLAAVGVSLVFAAYLLALPGSSLNFQLGISALSLAWALTTGLGFAAIRRGLVEQHREWMIRSYVVTFGFVTFRVIFEVLTALELGTRPERIAVCSWASWSVPLLITEVIIQGRKIWIKPAPAAALPRRRAPEPRMASAAGATRGGAT